MKTGFSYYNIDTDRYQDRRIKRLRKDCGCAGIAVYDYILCEIYRVRGYFLEWDESSAFDVADYFGLKESLVNHIVDFCCVVGLFNRDVLTNEGILSSRSIQQRYVEMCRRAKRSTPLIHEKFMLIPEEHVKLPEESLKTQEVFHRVKKSKVEKSKVKERECVCENAHVRESSHPDEPAMPAPSPTPSLDFLGFQDFILQHAPRVSEMKEPFTEKQFGWMCKDYKAPFIKTILTEMHNHADLFRNVSAYITFKKFVKQAQRK